MLSQSASMSNASAAPILCARDVASAVRPVFNRWKWKQECFVVLLLDTAHSLIGWPVVAAVGSVDSVAVHPRDVFREAVRRNAQAVIIAHCHPSGVCSPSETDRLLTSRLKECASLLGIPLLDHVIVTRDSQLSLSEMGLM